MSHNHFILKMLNIKDVIDTLSTNKEKTILIKARLSYPVARCVNCGFDTVLKNGFAKAHIRLDSLNGQRYEMLLHKQRFICKSCHSTFGVTTSLNKPNQTLSCKLKNQIMLLPKEGLNNELIARICHCSASSVRRTIIEQVKSKYRVSVLPKHLCFDEFRSVKNVFSFICCDTQSHKLVVKLPIDYPLLSSIILKIAIQNKNVTKLNLSWSI